MKKALLYWFTFLFLLLCLVACSSKKTITQKEITTETTTQTLHDTFFSIEKDSSYYKALLECQNGKVVIKKIKKTGFGRKLKQPQVAIENNQLNVDCSSEAEKLFASWKSTFVKSYTEKSIPIVTNELTWFQKTQIYIGRIALVLIAIYLLVLIYKKNI